MITSVTKIIYIDENSECILGIGDWNALTLGDTLHMT